MSRKKALERAAVIIARSVSDLPYLIRILDAAGQPRLAAALRAPIPAIRGTPRPDPENVADGEDQVKNRHSGLRQFDRATRRLIRKLRHDGEHCHGCRREYRDGYWATIGRDAEGPGQERLA